MKNTMAKKKSKKKNKAAKSNPEQQRKLSRKEYEQELVKLHAELVKLQLYVRKKGRKIIVVFEGRDAAGKGGVIKRITERVSPRVFRVEALPAPTDREKTQMYGQRYIRRFPAAGEVVLFDRSWYNRAGVERVMKFCTKQQYERFLRDTPTFERWMVESGIQLIKYWFDISMEEQERRFQARSHFSLAPYQLSFRQHLILFQTKRLGGIMKRSFTSISVFIIAGLLLLGCQEEAFRVEMIRPVKALKVADVETFENETYNGIAKATQEVDLSFRVDGPMIERPVKVGDEVKECQLVARIDPRDYEVRLRNAQGQLQNAIAVRN